MNNKFLLPMARKNILGAIKVGAGLSVEKDGTLNVADVSASISLVREGKQMIADAITEKGIDTASDATFEEMANNISNIQSGGGSNGYITNSIELTARLTDCNIISRLTLTARLTDSNIISQLTFATSCTSEIYEQ